MRWQGGSSIVQVVKSGSRRDAARFEHRLSAWLKGAGETTPAAPTLPEMGPPDLPALQRPARTRSRLLLAALPQLFFMFLAAFSVSLLLTGNFGFGYVGDFPSGLPRAGQHLSVADRIAKHAGGVK